VTVTLPDHTQSQSIPYFSNRIFYQTPDRSVFSFLVCPRLGTKVTLYWGYLIVLWLYTEGTWLYCEFILRVLDCIVTLYWGYLIVLWLFHLVCILYCVCFNWLCNVGLCGCGFCNVWVCVCVGVLLIRVLVFTVFCIFCAALFVLFRLYIFIRICFVRTGVRTTVTEWQLNFS
jgi:hypothetical protein